MNRSYQISVIFVLFLMAFDASALEKYAGDWKMISMQFKVSVISWGGHCGPRPSSYQSKKAVPVKITSKGRHLVFSKGGLRTDRCGSPNPRLDTLSATASDGRWIRVCQTDKSDSKYEKGKYSLVATGVDRLEFTAESKFDWTLKDDHCIADSKERRVYVRVKPGEQTEDQDMPPVSPMQPPPDEDPSIPGCENPGPALRISLLPKRMDLAPSERECFRVVAVDGAGCKTSVKANWTVSQGGQNVRGLITPNGCFVAGDNAAESEGLYEVTAKYRGKGATAEVFVAFPDIAELLAARLRPLDDVAPNDSAGPEPKQADLGGIKQDEAGDGGPHGLIDSEPRLIRQAVVDGGTSPVNWAVPIVVGILLFGGLILVLILVRRRSRARSSSAEFDDWLDNVDEERVSDYVGESAGGRRRGSSENVIRGGDSGGKKTCPKCHRSYGKDVEFCSEDGASLVLVKPAGSDGPRSSEIVIEDGEICPKCHRGYDKSAGFCPHDSEKLMSYRQWRSKKRN